MTELALDVIVYGGCVTVVILGATMLTSDAIEWIATRFRLYGSRSEG